MTSPGAPRQGGGRLRVAVVVSVLGLVGAALLVFALTSQVGAPPQPALRTGAAGSDTGETGAEQPSGGGSAEPSAVPPAASSARSAQPSEQPSAGSSAQPSQPPIAAALPASEPVRVRIDVIGVDEEVFPLGLGADGTLLAPSGERADLAAWFEGSPTPGEAGPSVIEGHVTWGGDPSVFFELGALRPGDRIEVDREDGSVATFEVYDVARFPKDAFPTVAVYGRTEGPELRLITCGGELDADAHHLDNTVVFARLVET